MASHTNLKSVWRCAIALFLGAAIVGCASATKAPAARINHVVLFKLEDPAHTDELLRDCRERIITIPAVASHFVGTHYDIGRDAIDSDYHVGLYVGFDTEAGYREYLAHPDHVALVEKWRDRWEWIRIYDIGEQ